jgi:hypothetical protein
VPLSLSLLSPVLFFHILVHPVVIFAFPSLSCILISHVICTSYCHCSPHIVAVAEDSSCFPSILVLEHWVFPKHSFIHSFICSSTKSIEASAPDTEQVNSII